MDARDTLRHFLAALAYRLQKSIRGAPEDYWYFEAGQGVRTPGRIVRHINGVLSYAVAIIESGNLDQRTHLEDLSWQDELERFHQTLKVLDQHLLNQPNLSDDLLRRLLQGPLSDAMTHIGQLATLRRMAGFPVRAENFMKANVQTGHLGADQPEPLSPDPE